MPEEPVTERIVERPTTTIVERSGSGAGVIFAVILAAIIAVAAYFLFVENESRETNAVVGAAQSVGDAAQRAANAAEDAADSQKTPQN